MSKRGGRSRAQQRPLTDSEGQDIRQLLMNQPGYRPPVAGQAEGQTPASRPTVPGQQEGQTSASQDDFMRLIAEDAGHPTGLTQLGYRYTPSLRLGDESIAMLSEPPTLTQIGLLPHGYFDQPPRHSSDVDDSQAPGQDDEHDDDEHDDDDADVQHPESTDPSRWVIGVDEVQTIGMYAPHYLLYIHIYLCIVNMLIFIFI